MRIAISVLLVLITTIFSQPASAGTHNAQYVRIQLHSANISDTAFTTLLSKPFFDVKRISVFSTSQNPVEIAIGAAGSEIAQMLVPAGTLSGIEFNGAPVGKYTGQTNFFPLLVGAQQRVAVRCLRSPCTTGELQVNFFYN